MSANRNLKTIWLNIGCSFALALMSGSPTWAANTVECGKRFVTFPAVMEDKDFQAAQRELDLIKLEVDRLQNEHQTEGYEEAYTITGPMVKAMANIYTPKERMESYKLLNARDKRVVNIAMLDMRIIELEKVEPTMGSVTVKKDDIREVSLGDGFMKVLTKHGTVKGSAEVKEDLIRCLN